MLYARSATRWPARTLALASISVAAFLFAAGSASAVPFTNAAAVPIADAGGTSANPTNTQGESDITASGVVGNISKVTATLNGYNHACPIDSDVLLVGPAGQTSILMSDIGDCKGAARAGVNLVFDDAAAGPVPCILSSPTVTNTLAAGTYQPTDASPATNGGAIGCDPPNDGDHSPGATPGPLADVFTGVTEAPRGLGQEPVDVQQQQPERRLAPTRGGPVPRRRRFDQRRLEARLRDRPADRGRSHDLGHAAGRAAADGSVRSHHGRRRTGLPVESLQRELHRDPRRDGATYVPQSSDANTAITVTEAVTNSSGAVATATSAPTATVTGGTVLPDPTWRRSCLLAEDQDHAEGAATGRRARGVHVERQRQPGRQRHGQRAEPGQDLPLHGGQVQGRRW